MATSTAPPAGSRAPRARATAQRRRGRQTALKVGATAQRQHGGGRETLACAALLIKQTVKQIVDHPCPLACLAGGHAAFQWLHADEQRCTQPIGWRCRRCRRQLALTGGGCCVGRGTARCFLLPLPLLLLLQLLALLILLVLLPCQLLLLLLQLAWPRCGGSKRRRLRRRWRQLHPEARPLRLQHMRGRPFEHLFGLPPGAINHEKNVQRLPLVALPVVLPPRRPPAMLPVLPRALHVVPQAALQAALLLRGRLKADAWRLPAVVHIAPGLGLCLPVWKAAPLLLPLPLGLTCLCCL